MFFISFLRRKKINLCFNYYLKKKIAEKKILQYFTSETKCCISKTKCSPKIACWTWTGECASPLSWCLASVWKDTALKLVRPSSFDYTEHDQHCQSYWEDTVSNDSLSLAVSWCYKNYLLHSKHPSELPAFQGSLWSPSVGRRRCAKCQTGG